VFVAEFFLNTFAHVPLVGFVETPPIDLSSRVFIYFVQKGSDASRCLLRLLASTGHIGSLLREMEIGASVGLRGLLAVLQTAGRCAWS
jgi:hypothetical protein